MINDIKIGIIGLGLIGGSIAKALKCRLNCTIVASNRSEPSLIKAKADGIIDSYSLTELSIFSGCDVVFICTPVDKIPYYVEQLLPHLDKDCIITDVGSTKQGIYSAMKSFGDICYIGGHPMAGSEKTSYAAASESLMQNACYILTPFPNVPKEKLDIMLSLVKLMGAKPYILSPDMHDKAVAAISHTPHIVASALVNTVHELADSNGYMHAFAAGGFKDITRIASSSSEVWSSICHENRECILEVLKTFKNKISQVEQILQSDSDISSFFDEAREYRNSFDK
jgi:prephenate dehydrogenase